MPTTTVGLQAPNVEQALEMRDDGTFVFIADGVEIEDPFYSTCMRFHVGAEFYGFTVYETGGNCTALRREFTFEGRPVHMLLTDFNASHVVEPTDDQFLIGVYSDENESCRCWTVTRDGGDLVRSDVHGDGSL